MTVVPADAQSSEEHRKRGPEKGLRYIILGAGMAGMLAAINLLKKGRRNFTVYEKADRVGGTWRENTYPGLFCDVPAHAYTYSFEPNPDWSGWLAPGPEIQDYFERVSNKYGLASRIAFNEEVVRCEFSQGRWHIETKSGRRDVADVVIAATGVLHHPRLPEMKGMDRFKGAIFHSARWDHSAPLDDQRIAIVGTGSTGVQLVSALAPRARSLAHFQRTPQWIMPVENPPYSEDQKQAFRNSPELLHQAQHDPQLEGSIERFSVAITEPDSEAMQHIQTVVREHLESSVQDPALREKLRPAYKAACKRMIYATDFYEAVQRANVEVIIEGVSEIEHSGIRTSDGVLREFDVIVLATGFHAHRFMRPMQVVGRNGMDLGRLWERRPRAYLAITMPDFPNFFMLNGPNGPVGNFSLIEIAEHQWHYIEQLIALIEDGRCREVCVSQASFEAFELARIAAAKKTIFATGCDSWYLDAEGVPATWPWTRAQFAEAMSAPEFDAFELT